MLGEIAFKHFKTHDYSKTFHVRNIIRTLATGVNKFYENIASAVEHT